MSGLTVSFLDQLVEECRTVVVSEDPPVEVSPEDNLIDDPVDDYIKRLFSVLSLRFDNKNKKTKRAIELKDKVDELENQGGGLLAALRNRVRHKAEDEVALYRELEQLSSEILVEVDEINLISEIFWVEIRRRHPILRDKPIIGIRKGWKLCWNERKAPRFSFDAIEVHTPEDLKRAILGAIGEPRKGTR